MRNFAGALAATACLASGAAGAATFDIVFAPLGEPTEDQAFLLSEAEFFWESLVTGYRDGIDIGPLTIEVGIFDLDGPDGILAESDVLEAVEAGGFVLPVYGFVDFDVADVDVLDATGDLFAVLLHEVAHVMGFGTLWVDNGLYENGSGRYSRCVVATDTLQPNS